MPRFVARPVIVEAHQFNGHIYLLPESFRSCVRCFKPGGEVQVMTGDGLRLCKHEDWIVRGPDGDFSVLRDAVFERWFVDYQPPVEKPARLLTKKELSNVR